MQPHLADQSWAIIWFKFAINNQADVPFIALREYMYADEVRCTISNF